MNYVKEEVITRKRVSITNHLQEIGKDKVQDEIIAGLVAERKNISSKYFYNPSGSRLFEEITGLEEYYPTRTEKGILKKVAPELLLSCRGYELIELGPGDNSKISILLEAARRIDGGPRRYFPVDISQSAIRDSAEELVGLFPEVQIEGFAADFTSQFELIRTDRPALICFFGSTIGNFEWDPSLELLSNISGQMKSGDLLLLGMDLVKSESLLHAAYNDAGGVTEAFNKNILHTVNGIIESDFQTEHFDHLAFFNKEKSRIEMYLVANRDLSVSSPLLPGKLLINNGEQIHTENSHKYTRQQIEEMASVSGLRVNHVHTDERSWFAITEFRKP